MNQWTALGYIVCEKCKNYDYKTECKIYMTPPFNYMECWYFVNIDEEKTSTLFEG